MCLYIMFLWCILLVIFEQFNLVKLGLYILPLLIKLMRMNKFWLLELCFLVYNYYSFAVC